MFYSICCSWEGIILYLCIVVRNNIKTTCELINVLHFLCYILIMNPFITGHRALEKKQITQGNNRKVQKPSESHESHEIVLTLWRDWRDLREKRIFSFNSSLIAHCSRPKNLFFCSSVKNQNLRSSVESVSSVCHQNSLQN